MVYRLSFDSRNSWLYSDYCSSMEFEIASAPRISMGACHATRVSHYLSSAAGRKRPSGDVPAGARRLKVPDRA